MTLTTLEASLYPTHCLAVKQTNAPPNSPALMLPVDSGLYAKGFRPDLAWPKEDEPPPEIPIPTEPSTEPMGELPSIPLLSGGPIRISLPVLQITVPHLTSLPLLLLFGLKLETAVEILTYRLLPASVVDEFPGAPAMIDLFAKYPEMQFERYHMLIGGVWANILALGLRDERIVDMVGKAWNVARQAKAIRQAQFGVSSQQRY
jgi:hypothetical protein